MSLIESLVSMIGTTIVFVNEDIGILIAWNGSATFNVYSVSDDTIREIDVFTEYGIENVWQAKQSANEWFDSEIANSDDDN